MKLKSIFGVALIAGATLFSSVAYAADSYTVGTPIDLSTGKAVEDYEVGQIVALPIDFESSTGTICATGMSLNFDTNVLEYGADLTAITSDTNSTTNLMALGDVKFNTDQTKVLAVNGIYNKNALTGAITGVGTFDYSKTSTGTAKVTWSIAVSQAVSVRTTPEAYMIFTVKGAVNTDSLNVDLVTVNDSDCNVDATTGLTGDTAKANACVAAFQVDIDNDAIAAQGKWIQSLYAKVGDAKAALTVCNNDGVSTTYSFPTRVITNTTGNDAMTIEIYATVSDDEAGTTTTDVMVGTVNVTADSTATDYGTATNVDSVKQ